MHTIHGEMRPLLKLSGPTEITFMVKLLNSLGNKSMYYLRVVIFIYCEVNH